MTRHDPLAARSRLLRRAATGATALAVTAAAGTGLLTYKIAQDHAATSDQPNPSGSPTSGTTTSSGSTSDEHEQDEHEQEDWSVSGSGLGGSTQAQQQSPAGGSNGS
jgi:hypothetical protein